MRVMKKKELLALRDLKATPQMMKIATTDTPQRIPHWYGNGYREVYARGLYLRAIVENDLLKVAVFLPEHLRMGGRNAAFEVFVSRAESKFLTYDRLHDKWLTAKLDMLPWPRYIGSEEKWISEAGRKLVKNYLGGTHGGYEGLFTFQLWVRDEELKRYHKRETDPWDNDLAQVPLLPKDWTRWADKVGVQENYIFYHYDRKGVDTGYCTYCEKEVPIRRPRHNAQGRCPCCRHKVTFKSVGKAGTVRTKDSYVYLLQRCEDGVVMRIFQGSRKYPKGEYRTPERSAVEIRRIIYDIELAPRAYNWVLYKNQVMRWVAGHPCDPGWRSGYEGMVYGKTLPDLSKKELRRTGLIEAVHGPIPIDPEKYLAVLERVPQLEQMAKAGLFRLMENCIGSSYSVRERMKKSSSLTGMLGIDAQQLKRLRQNDGGYRFLTWLQYEKAVGKPLPDDAINWCCAEKIEPDDLKFIRGRMSVVQVCNYVRRQMAENHMDSNEVLNTWADYLSMAKRLGLDTDDEIIYRVRKLRQRHDELVSRCHDKDLTIRAGEVLEKYPHVDEILRSLKAKYEYAGENYAVLAPNCIEDVMREGEKLNHCVASSDRYWDRIESHEAYVLFLRRTAEPQKPYYTLEIEPDGTVRQKRTKFDRQEADIEEAKKFLAEWQRVVTKRLTAEDHKLAEKSRVLRAQEFEQMQRDNVIIRAGDLAGRPLVEVLMADLMENTAA